MAILFSIYFQEKRFSNAEITKADERYICLLDSCIKAAITKEKKMLVVLINVLVQQNATTF